MRRTIALALLTLLILALPTWAQDNEPLTGYCTDDGQPVPSRPLRPGEEVFCDQFGFITKWPDVDLSRHPDELPNAWELVVDTPTLPGFAYWAHVRLNDRWEIGAKAPKRQEPKAFLMSDSGRVVMPIRFFTEAIGGTVRYEAGGIVNLEWGGVSAILHIGQHLASVNGAQVYLDQPPLLLWDRTMVPIRFVMETFGAEVRWESASSTVLVHLAEATCSNESLCYDLGGQ